MISKIDLRKQLTEKRKTLETKILSDLICRKIKLEKAYINAKKIFAYYPKAFEVDITPLFKDENKKWFLPKTKGEELFFYEYKKGDELVKGDFGVYEPKKDMKTDIVPDLIIVPALSVDKNNYRLGYGKGYYDRFLTSLYEKGNCPTTLVPIFSALIVETLPAEPHDKKINLVITEKDGNY